MTLARLCLKMSITSLKGQMQYRLSFLLDVIFGLFVQASGLLFVAIVLSQFDSMAGWMGWEIALIYGMRLTAHGIWTFCANQMYRFDQIIQNGEWDRYLLRPIPVWSQFMFSQMRLPVIIDLLLGITTLSVAIYHLDIDWAFPRVAFLVVSIMAGAMLDGGIQLFLASFTFKFMETLPIRVVFDQAQDRFANFPMTIYERPLQVLLTWVVPLAFMAWIPAAMILGKSDTLPIPTIVGYAAPIVGVAVFFMSVSAFKNQSRGYQSSGS